MDINDKLLLENIELLGNASNSDQLLEIHDFYCHQADNIAAFINSKGLVSLPVIENYDLFQPLLPLHLLTSNHTVLRLPPGGKENGYYVEAHRWRSSYDDIGCAYKSMLDFGNEDTVRNFINHAKPLLRQGILSLIPSNLISDFKGCGAPEQIDFDNLLNINKVTNTSQNSRNKENPLPLIQEIVMPIILNAKNIDFLKLITDEWESFQRCKETLVYASVEMEAATSSIERDIRFKNVRKIIDDGVDELDDKLKALNRKGIIKATGGILGSASLFIVNLTCNSTLGLLNSAIAAAILGATNCLNYMEYKEGVKGIKTKPFYFLWKLTRNE